MTASNIRTVKELKEAVENSILKASGGAGKSKDAIKDKIYSRKRDNLSLLNVFLCFIFLFGTIFAQLISNFVFAIYIVVSLFVLFKIINNNIKKANKAYKEYLDTIARPVNMPKDVLNILYHRIQEHIEIEPKYNLTIDEFDAVYEKYRQIRNSLMDTSNIEFLNPKP